MATTVTAQDLIRPAQVAEAALRRPSRSLWSDAWRQFRRHRLGMFGVVTLPVLPFLLMVTYLFRDPLKKVLGPEVGIFLLIVGVIGALNWMPLARLVRASFLSIKQKEFIEAARCIGASNWRIMLGHVL